MEFSDIFHGNRAVFSPDTKYVAVICGDTIDVRFTDSLLKAYRFACRDVVKIIRWCGDSTLLLSISGYSSMKIFSVTNGLCVASLKHPSCDINQVLWAPDFRSIVFLESFLFRITVWNLVEEGKLLGLNFIDNVQPWARPTIAFSPNGKRLAVVTIQTADTSSCGSSARGHFKEEEESCFDQITIISAITWRVEKNILCQGVPRVGGMQWSPDNDKVVIWSAYSPNSLIILSICSGKRVSTWIPSNNAPWAGLSEVAFSPSAQFLAVVGLDSRIHIINYITWLEEIELVHQLLEKCEGCHVYQQTKTFDSCNLQFKEIKERPLSISLLSMPIKAGTKSRICWSSGGRYLASCISRAPAVVWIWNAAFFFSLVCVIVMEQPLQDFSWDPVCNVLAMVSGDDAVVLWSAEKKELKYLPVCVPVPSIPFQASYLTWCSNGKILCVSSEQNSALLELYSSE